ncbi:MAG: zinc metallopeptidase [Anaerolineales bacterium]|nr:zinc metallopeptidase [Anaerolineales bacterium]
MFFFDPMYLVFAAPALLLAMFAQWKVSSAYSKYTKVRNAKNIPGIEVAKYLMRANGLNLNVSGTPGELTDHYDPRDKTLYLSQGVAQTPSVAALAIVAHEVGHAVQDSQGYLPMRLRAFLVAPANAGPWIGYILFIIGIFINMSGLVWLGIVFFSLGLLFSLATLPVEFNASSRALQMLRSSALVGQGEVDAAKAVLNAAALTYVAAATQALSQLLYYVFIALNMRSRDD